eukprot:Lithocolla_globosa_v1_NODE_6172_length_1125_cov_102.966355.p2 type:complete len:102 gc:universal NODE_6172_length_1125_cov_102.966355:738-1043(+)
MAFLLKTTKLSARIIKKRVNLWHRIFSISSACLILMLTRRELMEPSILTCSFSFLLMTMGVNKTSLLARASISGLLWRSTTCELKFSRHIAAVKLARTAFR